MDRRQLTFVIVINALVSLAIVLLVTVGMALFLGVLDFFFGWLLRNIIAQNVLFYILGVVVTVALLGAAYLIGQENEA